MDRGKKLAAMAKKVKKEAVNTSLFAVKEHNIEKSSAERYAPNDGKSGSVQNFNFAYESKKNDKELALSNLNVKVFSFDLQQCLPTPYLRASMFFYKRPLWTFNLTVHDGATKKAQCYLWNETIAKRGANDIGSCLFKCLLDLPNTVRHVILYSRIAPVQDKTVTHIFVQCFDKFWKSTQALK